jgi:hypothetical protein
MATEKEMFELLGRMLADETLRQAMLEDPANAAAGVGVSLTEEQAAGLRSADLTQALEGLDERLSKRSFSLTVMPPTLA